MTRFLTILFVLMVTTLLVGQRFGFAWAGGDGYRPQRIATISQVSPPDRQEGSGVVVLNATYRRGETVSTGPGERKRIVVATQSIALDENTDVVLNDLRDDSLAIRLVRGRIYVDGRVTVTTNFTSTTITSGAISIVNYDFLETVSIAPLQNALAIVMVAKTEVFTTKKPVNVHETPPVSTVEIPFDVTAASVAEFYQWAMR
jgi:hypothetical protein